MAIREGGKFLKPENISLLLVFAIKTAFSLTKVLSELLNNCQYLKDYAKLSPCYEQTTLTRRLIKLDPCSRLKEPRQTTDGTCSGTAINGGRGREALAKTGGKNHPTVPAKKF